MPDTRKVSVPPPLLGFRRRICDLSFRVLPLDASVRTFVGLGPFGSGFFCPSVSFVHVSFVLMCPSGSYAFAPGFCSLYRKDFSDLH